MPHVDEELWGWVPHDDSEAVEGPFKSREEAVEFAEEHRRDFMDVEGEDPGLGFIATCSRIVPEEWVGTTHLSDLDNLLEEMEEQLSNDGWAAFDDSTFEVKEQKVAEASKALEQVLRDWAKQWLTAGGRFVVRGNYEKP